MSGRSIATVEHELAEARAELTRLWPSDEPGLSLRDAPSKQARETLQRVIRLQEELDTLRDRS